MVDPAAEHQPARPARVGQADEQGPDLVVVGDEAADQERLALVVLGLEPVPGPAAGHIGALELLGHHPLQALLAGGGQQGAAGPANDATVCQAGPATASSSSSRRRSAYGSPVSSRPSSHRRSKTR